MERNSARTIRRIATTTFVLGLGIVLGWVSSDLTTSHAQDRGQDDGERRAFLSGGARSEKVLGEIDATLRRIETRLESMEGIMKENQNE